MRVTDMLRMVAGSIGIYVVVAACGSHGSNGVATDGGSHPDGKADGRASVTDALTDPVGQAAADENQSGSRLKTQRFVGADTSSQFAGFFDSMLNVNCAFLTAADGMTRCLPTGASAAAVTTAYSDSACTQPLAGIAQACSVPKYAVEAVGNGGCPTPAEAQVYNVAAAYSGAVYDKAGSCVGPLTSAQTSAYTFYSLGAVVPASSFVAAKLTTD